MPDAAADLSKRTTGAWIFGGGLYIIAAIVLFSALLWKYNRPQQVSSGEAPQTAAVIPPLATSSSDPGRDTVVERPEEFVKGSPPQQRTALKLSSPAGAVSHDVIQWPGRLPDFQSLQDAPRGNVKALAIGAGSDGAIVVANPNLKILDSDSGAEKRKLTDTPIDSLAISPDGANVLAIAGSRLLLCPLTTTGAARPLLDNRSGCKCAAWTPNGRYIIAGCDDGAALVVDVNTNELCRELSLGETVTASAVHPNGWLVVLGGARGQIGFFDLDSQQRLWTEERHRASIKAIAVSPDGDAVISGDDAGKLYVWSGKHGGPVETFSAESPIQSMAFLDPNKVLFSTRSGAFQLVQIESDLTTTAGGSKLGSLQAFAVSPDRRSIVASFAGGGLGRFDLTPRPAMVNTPMPDAPPPTPPPVVVKRKAPLADAKKLRSHTKPNDATPLGLTFHPSSGLIVAATSNGGLAFYQPDSAAPRVTASATLPQAVPVFNSDKVITPTGAVDLLGKFERHPRTGILSASASGPEKKDSAIFGGETGAVFKVRTLIAGWNNARAIWDNQPLTSVALARDGQYCAVATTDRFAFATLPTGVGAPKRLPEMSFTGKVRGFSFVPRDGDEYLFVFANDASASLYSANGKSARKLLDYQTPPGGRIRAAAVSADGNFVAFAAGDEVLLFPTSDANPIDRKRWPNAALHGLAIAPDGAKFAVSTDAGVEVWEFGTPLERLP